MKKLFIPVILAFTLLAGACGNESARQDPEANTQSNAAAANTSAEGAANGTSGSNSPGTETASGTVTYQSENGPIEIPANPKRIVALTNAPNIVALGGSLVGVDTWTMNNPLFTDKLKDIAVVSEENPEQIFALEPDLIIAGSHMKNLDKLSEIAPTIIYTWGKLDYLSQQVEIGKVLNKEAEATAWVEDFTTRAKAVGEEIKAIIGKDATVSVLEYDTKNFYVFGNNWARGTELLYQMMELNMPEKAKKDALGPGYYTLSNEILPEYAGDYIVLSQNKEAQNNFLQSNTWKNIPAVKNGRVIEIDTAASSYSDPITLEYLLKIFKDGFLSLP
ncbi:iron-hydroxamate ABC transporter substrate-binding protein [Paenibacillus sp. MBLB2552]|uniref:Iron-hydroxamate ABC transporter substrate-binding protein n=1 Tax=Paenibacillus mellifer TaxID=2937794 RepID=A0A9X2BT92_9BACL|nr:iron-hydroxamate ABC transporter substrate-binding protein [Paenibacillus mellifer]MCK8487656.1 iron-hydroxamate ABC transporter substrate-binding protein [Paenibacillus mellifer]